MAIKPRTLSPAWLALCAVVFSGALTFAAPANSPTVIKVAELSLRKAATKIVMPEFPDDSRKRKVSGVAVIRILFNENGDVIKTKVLEAPDNSISNAVTLAVRQWRFQPQRVDGEPVYITGKLTFYFVNDRFGSGRVANPKQVD